MKKINEGSEWREMLSTKGRGTVKGKQEAWEGRKHESRGSARREGSREGKKHGGGGARGEKERGKEPPGAEEARERRKRRGRKHRERRKRGERRKRRGK